MTLLRYTWPIIGLILFQTFIVLTLPMKAGWSPLDRLALFLLVDVLIGLLQWLQFRKNRKIQQIIDRLRQGAERPQ